MTENIWLADELTEDIDWDLVTLVSNSLNYDINKVRAFVVALLDDANDDAAAIQVNDILKAAEQAYLWALIRCLIVVKPYRCSGLIGGVCDGWCPELGDILGISGYKCL